MQEAKVEYTIEDIVSKMKKNNKKADILKIYLLFRFLIVFVVRFQSFLPSTVH